MAHESRPRSGLWIALVVNAALFVALTVRALVIGGGHEPIARFDPSDCDDLPRRQQYVYELRQIVVQREARRRASDYSVSGADELYWMQHDLDRLISLCLARAPVGSL